MSTTEKKRSQAECVGFYLGWDIGDVRDNIYQPGRTGKVQVFTVGDDYVCCPAKGVAPPKGWEWKEVFVAYGRPVYRAEPEVPHSKLPPIRVGDEVKVTGAYTGQDGNVGTVIGVDNLRGDANVQFSKGGCHAIPVGKLTVVPKKRDELEPAFTDPVEALEFLSRRFKHAGVVKGVGLTYARDIDAILENGISDEIFNRARKYDCFFIFSDAQLRRILNYFYFGGDKP